MSLFTSVAAGAVNVTAVPGFTAVTAAAPTVAVGAPVMAGAVLPGVTWRATWVDAWQLSVTVRVTFCAVCTAYVCEGACPVPAPASPKSHA